MSQPSSPLGPLPAGNAPGGNAPGGSISGESAAHDAAERNASGDAVAGDAEAGNEAPVRRGSPFAKSTIHGDIDSISEINGFALATPGHEFDPEWGVLRASNWASAWVAICGLACLQMFPGGGVIVAALGCALATIGLFSSRAIFAAALLALHAWIFFACYQRLF